MSPMRSASALALILALSLSVFSQGARIRRKHNRLGVSAPTYPVGARVVISSIHGLKLQDNEGNVGLSRNAQLWEEWYINDVGNGKVTIKSHRSQYLQDNGGNVMLSSNQQESEQWTISEVGHYEDRIWYLITSNRNANLRDNSEDSINIGKVMVSSNIHEQERESAWWSITKTFCKGDGKDWCDASRCGRYSEWAVSQCETACSERIGCLIKPTPGNYKKERIVFPDESAPGQKEALLFEPPSQPDRKLPLIVSLHGSGGIDIGRDINVWMEAGGKDSKYLAKILAPNSGGDHWHPERLNKAVDYLLSTDDTLDKDRIYVLGFSLGGLGTWNWAKNSPERLAAVVPVGFKAGLDDSVERMVDLPIWAMAGTRDRQRAWTLPPMEAKLKELGSTSVKITLFDGARHMGSAQQAWFVEGLADWLFSQTLKNRMN